MPSVRFLILDEADRLLDMEFVEQTREIIESCTHPDVQKAVFSATLPSGAEKIALSAMTNPIRLVVGLKYATIFLGCEFMPHRDFAEIRLYLPLLKALFMLQTSRLNYQLSWPIYLNLSPHQSSFSRQRSLALLH